MSDYEDGIEIDTDTGDFLNVVDCGSTVSIEVWDQDGEQMKEEIILTKSQASLLVRALQGLE